MRPMRMKAGSCWPLLVSSRWRSSRIFDCLRLLLLFVLVLTGLDQPRRFGGDGGDDDDDDGDDGG